MDNLTHVMLAVKDVDSTLQAMLDSPGRELTIADCAFIYRRAMSAQKALKDIDEFLEARRITARYA
jgi:hypothetical protein